MQKVLAGLISVFFFLSGCSVKSTPPVDEYTIILNDLSKSNIKSTKCHKSVLKILAPFGAQEYATSDLNYVVLPNEQNRYNLSIWSNSLSSTLYKEITKSIKQSTLFESVINYASVAKSDYILEIEINDFKQYFLKDLKHSYVVVDLTFTLIEQKHFRVVAQREFMKKIKTKSLDAKGGVEALNNAFKDVTTEMISWLEEVCQ
ncbi:Putative lipoprotein [hydrothermal vent metagenome]|uniref:Putative lipoprotein n=1 Tax=hydrothermal vent metagenome TaxID=652676 RepID=A0A1W1BSB4_9ZZZZ